MTNLDQEQYQQIVDKCGNSAIDAIWEMLSPIHRRWTHFPSEVTESFELRTELFFGALARLLHKGQIKLHKKGVFLEGSVETQVQKFREAWPSSEKESGYEDFCWWFFDEECPAGVAWRQPDGSYRIAD
jgi:hypothetical protein